MERTELFDLMGELKLYGMRASYDEVMATAIKREHEPPRVVGDLLKAEIAEKHARSIKYQMTIAKLRCFAQSLPLQTMQWRVLPKESFSYRSPCLIPASP